MKELNPDNDEHRKKMSDKEFHQLLAKKREIREHLARLPQLVSDIEALQLAAGAWITRLKGMANRGVPLDEHQLAQMSSLGMLANETASLPDRRLIFTFSVRMEGPNGI